MFHFGEKYGLARIKTPLSLNQFAAGLKKRTEELEESLEQLEKREAKLKRRLKSAQSNCQKKTDSFL